MSPELLTIVLFGSLLAGVAIGIPLSFILGGVAILFTYFLWGPNAIYMIAINISGVQLSMVLVCAPLFIFMGNVLEKAGIADDLYSMMYQWIGPVRGGLAMGTVLICTIFAAMVGVSAVATITMGLIALPSMLKRGYHKSIAVGSISAGGALGILIPPSIIMIFYGFMAEVSIGQLFIGGVFPGFLLSSLFITYIGIRAWLQPSLAPAIPLEDRASLREKMILLRGLVLPGLLVIAVLGSIFGGVCSPTEASAIGGFGSLVCAAVKRRLSWKLLKESCYATLKLTGMVYWILLGAKAFTVAYTALGGQQLVGNLIASMEVSRWVILIAIQLSFFFMGMVLDPLGIIMITAPIFVPVITQLGFNPIWFGILYTLNMEMAYITPPFGWNLFYMKAIVPEGISMVDIYRSIVPFVMLQALGLALVMVFPQLALWLPSKMLT